MTQLVKRMPSLQRRKSLVLKLFLLPRIPNDRGRKRGRNFCANIFATWNKTGDQFGNSPALRSSPHHVASPGFEFHPRSLNSLLTLLTSLSAPHHSHHPQFSRSLLLLPQFHLEVLRTYLCTASTFRRHYRQRFSCSTHFLLTFVLPCAKPS